MTGIDPKDGLLIALAIFGLFYVVILWQRISKPTGGEQISIATPFQGMRAWALTFIGFFTNFFDVFGIGSFATTTATFRKWKLVPDERIPGTLNVGHTLPTIVQAYIFTKLVPVDATTLILMIAAAVVGSWIGAGVVARMPRRGIQLGMGAALLGFGVLKGLQAAGQIPGGGELLKLEGGLLAVGLVCNFLLGALMTIGIGLYAPCMVLISLLGMNPTAAFPIMMGSCAFLMPAASYRFVKAESFDLRATLGLIIGGIPGVLVAALLVKSLPLSWLNWLIVAVIFYVGYSMLQSARRERAQGVA